MTMGVGPLPPGAEFDEASGRVIRRLKQHANGREREIVRPVAFTREEALKEGSDYYDPVLGWLRAGRKTEQENPLPPPQDAMIRRRVPVAPPAEG